jgi:hypothetical protein
MEDRTSRSCKSTDHPRSKRLAVVLLLLLASLDKDRNKRLNYRKNMMVGSPGLGIPTMANRS